MSVARAAGGTDRWGIPAGREGLVEIDIYYIMVIDRFIDRLIDRFIRRFIDLSRDIE